MIGHTLRGIAALYVVAVAGYTFVIAQSLVRSELLPLSSQWFASIPLIFSLVFFGCLAVRFVRRSRAAVAIGNFAALSFVVWLFAWFEPFGAFESDTFHFLASAVVALLVGPCLALIRSASWANYSLKRTAASGHGVK